MATIDQPPGVLNMTQGYRFLEKVQLARIECDTAKRTLGTWINPQGKMKHNNLTIPSEFSVKEHQINEWATSIQQSCLSKKETHMAYFGILHAKVGYAMGVSTFTESDLSPLQWKVYSVFKQKIGLNMNFPSDVSHGPSDYGSLGNISLYTMQGYKQIQLLISSIRNKDEAGELIMASLQYEQMELGQIFKQINKITVTISPLF